MLLLFDIDGTLLLGAHALHRDALHEALTAVYRIGDPTAPHVLAAGRTDTAIAREIAGRSGVAGFDALRPAFEAACVAAYRRICPPTIADQLAPGIADLLARLAERPDIRLSLLTGNYEPIARLKLERAGIGHYFPSGQGAFGSDSERREDLPAIARARAGVDGEAYARDRTIVIGDTPRDIAAARADGVRAIAIATGPYDATELREADHVVRDARELCDLLANRLSVT